MLVFSSKNSTYNLDGENLIRDGDENLGSRFVYTSLEKIISVLEEYGINPKHARIPDKKTGDEIMAALEGKDMDPQETGGKYFALIDNNRGSYSIFCSGKILKIKDDDEPELKLKDE